MATIDFTEAIASLDNMQQQFIEICAITAAADSMFEDELEPQFLLFRMIEKFSSNISRYSNLRALLSDRHDDNDLSPLNAFTDMALEFLDDMQYQMSTIQIMAEAGNALFKDKTDTHCLLLKTIKRISEEGKNYGELHALFMGIKLSLQGDVK